MNNDATHRETCYHAPNIELGACRKYPQKHYNEYFLKIAEKSRETLDDLQTHYKQQVFEPTPLSRAGTREHEYTDPLNPTGSKAWLPQAPQNCAECIKPGCKQYGCDTEHKCSSGGPNPCFRCSNGAA